MDDHYKIRRGDTLQLAGTLSQDSMPFDLGERAVTATLLRADGTRVATVPVRVLDAAQGLIELGGTGLVTSGWPPGVCRLVVQMLTPQGDGSDAVQTFAPMAVEVTT